MTVGGHRYIDTTQEVGDETDVQNRKYSVIFRQDIEHFQAETCDLLHLANEAVGDDALLRCRMAPCVPKSFSRGATWRGACMAASADQFI